jgi:enterochelin esterase-like enzyme
MEQGWITSFALTNNLYRDPATRNYRVYLPPSYDAGAKRYPVVYVLHSWYYDETDMVSKLKPTLDLMIRQRTIGEMIAVFPNAQNALYGSFYLSSPVLGDYETYIVKDLVQLIDTRYRTLAVRESRGLTGYSMGGMGTMHLALKFPEVFAVAVAESCSYNSRSQFNDARARSLASYHPTNLSQFNAILPIDWHLCAFQALLAGLLPNVQRPSLYTDYPYEWVNGQPVLSASADQRCRQGDVQNGDLGRYVLQPVRLNGIMIVHATADTDVPVIEARGFTNALSQAGVQFEYQEHTGMHEYRTERALPFLSRHLQGAELYIAPARLTLTLATNGFQLAFPTQTNVQYTIESAAVVDASSTNWAERTRVTGDLRTATVTLPLQGGAEFFRIKATNLRAAFDP